MDFKTWSINGGIGRTTLCRNNESNSGSLFGLQRNIWRWYLSLTMALLLITNTKKEWWRRLRRRHHCIALRCRPEMREPLSSFFRAQLCLIISIFCTIRIFYSKNYLSTEPNTCVATPRIQSTMQQEATEGCALTARCLLDMESVMCYDYLLRYYKNNKN